ncbi:hypothetical protein, partial [Pseudomonas sp. FW305-33]|uniref:hypothetical protein n=1 Tax=Pseudomonas sp. FW305-33 TaxID=2751337 RepID=UPI001C496013
ICSAAAGYPRATSAVRGASTANSAAAASSAGTSPGEMHPLHRHRGRLHGRDPALHDARPDVGPESGSRDAPARTAL